MNFVDGLNEMQQKAVLQTEGPLLVLAGAGSGKTRVLTHRIAYMIEEKKIKPWSILAITFTNKAAAEMKERIGRLIGEDTVQDMWVSTFHSMCVRILRRNAEEIGYGRYFTIYDTSDQKALLKDVIKSIGVNEKNFAVSAMIGAISAKKNEFILPHQYLKEAQGDYREETIAKIYMAYQKKLKENNAMDFDDLLLNTCVLFKEHPDVLAFYQNKFRYILVDEYQDTNGVQYQLVQMLARAHNNLCVVGDDDQSIYGWRGADVKNILDFERDFQNTVVIKLEQNYRSTKNILEAANKVVANNYSRKAKKLWTDNDEGEEISVFQLDNEYREADAIKELIIKKIEAGERDYKDFAILYRTNVQSRVIEEKMISNSIPYRLLGGVRFYERREIKDLVAYLRVVANVKDDVSMKRIINVPKRGIGATSVTKLTEYGESQNMDFFEAARVAQQFGVLGKAPASKVMLFVTLIEELREIASKDDVYELLEAIIEKTGYIGYLRQTDGEEAKERIANVEELVSKAAGYMKEAEEPSLDAFLEDIALVADVDNYDEQSNSIVLMTLHSAKGLEFPVVFMPGVEEGLFPSFMSMTEGEDKLEEERRLCYVGITRAREKLYMLYAQQRTVYGKTQASMPSRFLKELPIQVTNLMRTQQKPGQKPQQKKPSFQSAPSSKMAFSGRTPQQKTAFQSSNGAGKKIENLPKVTQQFNKGDRVKHKLFGEGSVIKVDQTVDDVFVTVNFDKGMVRKLSVRFAKLQNI